MRAVSSFRRASIQSSINTAFSELISYRLKVSKEDNSEIRLPIQPEEWGEAEVYYGFYFADKLNRLGPGPGLYKYKTTQHNDGITFIVTNEKFELVSSGYVAKRPLGRLKVE